MIMASTRIENENWNWSALTVFNSDARNAPEIPPNAAPEAYAMSLVLTAGTPIATAATSSSRRATHARPNRESRRRKFTNSTIANRNNANQYQGFKFNPVNGSRNGRSMRSTGE